MTVDDDHREAADVHVDTDEETGTVRPPSSLTRRSIIGAAAGVVAVAAAGAITAQWRPSSSDGATPAATPGPASTDPNPVRVDDENPGPLPPPKVTVAGLGTTGAGDIIATTAIGLPCTITVQVAVKEWTRVLRGMVVVAKPGSVSGAYDPALAPDNAAMRPENHLGESELVADATAGLHDLHLSFQAAEPGTYPVFYLSQLIDSGNRRIAAPTTDTGATVHDTSAELGAIVVK